MATVTSLIDAVAHHDISSSAGERSLIAIRFDVGRPTGSGKTRRKIDAGLKAKIALEALREQSTVADLARRYGASPEPVDAWKLRASPKPTLIFPHAA